MLLVILPPVRSFSINGLRLTNAKTSFAAGFGLHHWSILEGEFDFHFLPLLKPHICCCINDFYIKKMWIKYLVSEFIITFVT